MNDHDHQGHVAAVAVTHRVQIKPLSLPFVAKQIPPCTDDGAKTSEAEIYKHLQHLQTVYADQFGGGAPALRESASERLERANAQASAREQSSSIRGVIEVSDKQRARLEKMTPDQRLAFANEKAAP